MAKHDIVGLLGALLFISIEAGVKSYQTLKHQFYRLTHQSDIYIANDPESSFPYWARCRYKRAD